MLLARMKSKTLWATLLLGFSNLLIGPSLAGIDEGIEYQLVTPPVRTANPEKIEVVEMFWYGCPHCFQFEPVLEQWKSKAPANVEIIRIPAIFPNKPEWEASARAFYTAELLGVLDKIHTPLFEAIHKKRQRLFTKETLAEFFASQGVSKNDFNQTYDSFGVQMKVNRAKDLTQRYGIGGVPTMVINGRYQTHASLTNGQAGLLKVVDFLIDKENTAKK